VTITELRDLYLVVLYSVITCFTEADPCCIVLDNTELTLDRRKNIYINCIP